MSNLNVSKYRINSSGNDPRWHNCGICELGISPGHDAHEGDKFESILAWAERNFEKTVITLSDTLYRYNFLTEGITDVQAYKKGLQVGERWLFKNRALLQRYQDSISYIHRWDKWLMHPDYTKTYYDLLTYFESDADFKSALEKDVNKFTKRKSKQGCTVHQDTLRNSSRLLLLEEMACYILIARTYEAARVYPARDLESFQYIRLNKTPDNLKGLEKAIHVKIILNRKASAFKKQAA